MKRGEIWWANLGPPRGSGPGYRRPAVVIQSDQFNDTRINTIAVAMITSRLSRGASPGNVEIPEKESGLPKRSVVNVTQLATIDRTDLIERAGTLPGRRMAEVDAGLKLVLGLT